MDALGDAKLVALVGGLQWGRGLGAAECPHAAHVAAWGKERAPSMGPRLRSRGMDIVLTSMLVRGFLLQWGRGLGAAECRRSPKTRRPRLSFNGAAA